MTHKDWILLLVPIISNGFILYITQLYFQSKLKLSEHKNEVKRKISGEFFDRLLEVKSNFKALGYAALEHPDDSSLFTERLSLFNLSIKKALDYYEDYKFYLKDYSSDIESLSATFADYVAYGQEHLQLDDQSRNRLETYINELYTLICQASDLYLKNI